MAFSELRRFRRIQLGSGYFTHFRVQDRSFFGIQLLSLGAGGCSLKLPQMLADRLQANLGVSRIHLVHAELPVATLQGRIAWVHSHPRNMADGSVEVGIEFMDLDPDLMEILDAYVETCTLRRVRRPA